MAKLPSWDHTAAPIALGRRFYQIAVAVTAEVQAPAGLRPLELGLLMRVHDAPGIDQHTLAERMALDRTTTGQMVQRLEREGLIARTVNGDDRRARMLQLTPAGRRLHDDQRPKAQAAQARMLSALTAAERRMLLDLMARVIAANPEYVRPGAGRRALVPRVRMASTRGRR